MSKLFLVVSLRNSIIHSCHCTSDVQIDVIIYINLKCAPIVIHVYCTIMPSVIIHITQHRSRKLVSFKNSKNLKSKYPSNYHNRTLHSTKQYAFQAEMT